MTRSMMKRPAVLALASLLLILAGPAWSDQDPETAGKEAAQAATEWLKLMDAGEYGQSWDLAAPLLKNGIDRDGWIRLVKGTRAPLGEALSREIVEAKYSTTLPGAPDGHWVVTVWSVTFQNKREAREAVVLGLEDEGEWKVAGFFLK